MSLLSRARRFGTRHLTRLGLVSAGPDVSSYAVPAAEVERMRGTPPTPAHAAFFKSQKRPAHKWSHYLDVYDRYLRDYPGKRMVLLEIGVLEGGSLDMWRHYLGPDATIVGVDINPACTERVDAPNLVRIGSQADPAFLKGVVDEVGAPDVILDDGSHEAGHQKASFEILFPLLKDGGIYMIEDAHTSYWTGWEGGYRRSGTAIEEAKRLVDDMHGWYHPHGAPSRAHEQVEAVHFHDSVIVIEKKAKPRPGQMTSRAATLTP